MQWSDDAHAGFSRTDNKPWLPVSNDYKNVNVAAQQDDTNSMLALYRRLLALRRESTALTAGSYRTIRAENGVLIYAREDPDQRMLVALNLTRNARTVALSGRVRLSTRLDRQDERASDKLRLRSNEGAIVEADPSA
jgi:alpha-glucosidase